MRNKKLPIKIILSLSLAILLILWSVVLLTSNPYIWFLIQKRNNVDIENSKIYNNDISSFLNGKNKELNFLTQDEISHLKDVRKLVISSDLIFLTSIILFLSGYFYLKQSIKFILRKISISVLVVLIFLSTLTIFSFQWLFIKFHEIFFVGNYYFPSSSMLKTLYPDSFFRDIFILYFILSILGCVVWAVVSYKVKSLKTRN